MKKVLIVEDEAPLREAYEAILSMSGFRVMVAEDGKKGLKAVERFQPDLVLLDMLMPVMNGLDFLRIFSKSKQTQRTKIILFSNFSNAEMEHEIFNFGVNESILKSSIDPNGLVELVNKHLQSK